MKEKLIPHIQLADRFITAVAYATTMHRDQSRKSTTLPYICHPLGVASLLIEAGADEDQVIAGLLHDVAEDCGGEPRLVDIKEMFGKRVAEIVRGCSDSLTESTQEKAPWRERKEIHLEHLRMADADVLVVSAADKLHNARAISTDYLIIKENVWERFNADRNSILWYYREMLAIFTSHDVPRSLTEPLNLAISQMAS